MEMWSILKLDRANLWSPNASAQKQNMEQQRNPWCTLLLHLCLICAATGIYSLIQLLPWVRLFNEAGESSWAAFAVLMLWFAIMDMIITPFNVFWILTLTYGPLLGIGRGLSALHVIRSVLLSGTVFAGMVVALQAALFTTGHWPFPFSPPVSAGIFYCTVVPLVVYLCLPSEVMRSRPLASLAPVSPVSPGERRERYPRARGHCGIAHRTTPAGGSADASLSGFTKHSDVNTSSASP